MRLLVVLAVGLTPRDLADAPALRSLADAGFAAPLAPVFPAVTCSAQATYLTGQLPRAHGIVGNGWYFRDLAEIWFWRQSNHLIEGPKLYETARRRWPDLRIAKLFWWYNMYADVAFSLTPRPEYLADGRKKPGLHSYPPALERHLQERLGTFPLFHFWGPAADLRSTRWIVEATRALIDEEDPDAALVYLPHLDYDHQRYGPDHARSRAAVTELDGEAARLIEHARARGARVQVISEYGIEPVHHPIYLNRVLHAHGYLAVHERSHGQLLDAGACRAFAVADHQVAHVYVRHPEDLRGVQRLLASVPGVEHVLDPAAQVAWGIDHARAGELVVVAAAGAWFAYPYWLDEARCPDFAHTVEIHRKPGYDPAELFLDPALRWPRLRIARRLLARRLGLRSVLDVIGTDASLVRGSHGRPPSDPERGALFIDSDARAGTARVEATEVHDRILAALDPGGGP